MKIKVNNNFLLLATISLLFLKIIFFILIKNNFLTINLGGGSDADYYDQFAEGFHTVEVNIWPVILRYLNEAGLYSRDVISYIFLFLNLLAIPYLTNRISGLNFNASRNYYLYVFLICLIYPTLYFCTFGSCRDVFMVFCFLIGCLAAKKAFNSSFSLVFISYFILTLLIGLFLAELRPYLGAGFIGAMFLCNIKFTKKRLVILSFLYLLALFAASYVGIFDALTEYRAGFEEGESGSNLGLDFSNPAMFIPNFILSFLGQMLGLYITNPLAIVLVVIETIPFFLMLIYIIKNIKWADKFIRFLIIFFVLYGSVWLIGNDNLGTAVRLRLYNYFAIYISFFYILNLKEKSLKKRIR